MEIRSDGFKYRNLSGSHEVLCAEVGRAYIEAATPFTALETNGFPIEVPDLRAARRLADRVRAEQAKMRG